MSSSRNSNSSRAAHARRQREQRDAWAPLSGLSPHNDRPVVHRQLSRIPSAFEPDVQTFPNTMKTKLKWAWTGNLATQAGSATTQLFRLNSLYDPDETGTGDQPRYFDTLCAASGGTAPYTYFRVKKVHYRIGFHNTNSTAATAGIGYVQVYLGNAISVTCTLNQYYDMLNGSAATYSANANENAVQWIDGVVDLAKFLGVRDFDDDEDLVGSYVANPGTVVHLATGVRSLDDTTVASIRVIAQFCYDVEFFGLNNAGES